MPGWAEEFHLSGVTPLREKPPHEDGHSTRLMRSDVWHPQTYNIINEIKRKTNRLYLTLDAEAFPFPPPRLGNIHFTVGTELKKSEIFRDFLLPLWDGRSESFLDLKTVYLKADFAKEIPVSRQKKAIVEKRRKRETEEERKMARKITTSGIKSDDDSQMFEKRVKMPDERLADLVDVNLAREEVHRGRDGLKTPATGTVKVASGRVAPETRRTVGGRGRGKMVLNAKLKASPFARGNFLYT